MVRKDIRRFASMISVAAPALLLCVFGAAPADPNRPQPATWNTPAPDRTSSGLPKDDTATSPFATFTNAATFTRDVAPIFFSKCAACHRPGAAAPMSLLNYSDVRPWASSIKEKVLTKTMPPWHADPAYDRFENDRRLSAREITTIVDWVDGGAPEGDPKDLPPRPVFNEAWKIGKPDIVLSMPVKYDV